MTGNSYDDTNVKPIVQFPQHVQSREGTRAQNDIAVDSSVHYQLEPMSNQSSDHLFKNESGASSPTNSEPPRLNLSREINASGSHVQDYTTVQVQHGNWSPPPTYSKSPEPHIHGKRTDDGHVLEAGLSGEDSGEINELKEGLQTDKQIRMAFVRKVYFLLSAQLLCTTLVCVWFMVDGPVKDYVQNHPVLFFISWILSLITLVALFWFRKKYPLNIFLLFVFTIISSYSIGTAVSMYSAKVVLQSLIITFGIFLALQLFTLQSKFDFSSWGPFLYACLWALIFATIVGFLFPFEKGFHIAISIGAALLFSAYIIYDTYMIFKRMSPEEYIVAVVELYLDILNVFALLIAIIGGACESSSS